MASLVLTRQSQIDWLGVTCLGEAEATVRLGIKSWLVDVGLGTSDSHFGPIVAFLKQFFTFD